MQSPYLHFVVCAFPSAISGFLPKGYKLMAGDWIKMRSDLHTHPKVVRISSALNADRLRVVGALHAIWSVFDAHSVDGVLEGYSFEAMDDVISWPGFSQAMAGIKWLERAGDCGLKMPEFQEHNGASAKRRAEDGKRKKAKRASEGSPQPVRILSATDADELGTREEKSREDKEQVKSTVNLTVDPPLRNGALKAEAENILAFLNEKANRKFPPVAANLDPITSLLKQGFTPSQCRQVIAKKLGQWGSDEKMAVFVRPKTLFGKTNFANYVGELVLPREAH